MNRPVRPVTVVFLLALVAALVFVFHSRQPSSPPPAQPVGAPQPIHDTTLGIMWSHETEGFRIMGFLPPPSPSPLALLGLAMKDQVLTVNGQNATPNKIKAAVRACRDTGQPITIEFVRAGQRKTLRIETLPALPGPLGEASTPPAAPEEPEAPGAGPR